jgi:hypothetical protein
MRKRLIAAATFAAVVLPCLPAAADPPPWAPAHGRRAHEAQAYDSRGYYVEPRPITRADYVWRGHDGRYYCRRSNGTTGLVIGAGVGALVGHELAGGDRTLGTIVGAAAGGLLGREIDRGQLRCH